MRRCSDVSFRSHIGRNVATHAETLSWRLNWYVNEMDLFEMPLRRLIGTYIKPTNLRRCNDVPVDTYVRLTNLTRRRDVIVNTEIRLTSLRRCSKVLATSLMRLNHRRCRKNVLPSTQIKFIHFSD